MRGVVMYGPGDVRVEDVEDPTIIKPTDAIIRRAADRYRAMDERRAVKVLLRPGTIR